MRTHEVVTVKRYTPEFIRRDFQIMGPVWRKARARMKPLDSCFRCKHKLQDGEPIDIAFNSKHPNRVLCRACTEWFEGKDNG